MSSTRNSRVLKEVKMKTVLLILFMTTVCVSTAAQDDAAQFKMPPVPERAAAPEGFVPKGWRLLGNS